MATVACPVCGSPVEVGARFCPNCSYYLEWDDQADESGEVVAAMTRKPGDDDGDEPPPEPPPLPTVSEPEETVVCTVCGTVNPASRTLCQRCGEPLHQEEPLPPPPPPPPPPRPPIPPWVFWAGGALLLAVLLAVAVTSGGSDPTPTTSGTAAPATTDATVPTETAVTTSLPQDTTAPPPAVTPLVPASISATATRPPVPQLLCGGSNSFEPELLIDGDANTGWGAGTGDGTGESVTVTFAEEVHLTQIGLSPGYLRLAPRSDQDCQDVLAFEYNRFVDAVEYRFDDGSVLRHDFVREPSIQTLDVGDVVTRSVTITILSTQAGTDDDTILSEAVFAGYIQ